MQFESSTLQICSVPSCAAMCARLETFGDLSRLVSVSKPLTVQLDDGDQMPDGLAALQGARMRELRTKGDGACAVHAGFGSATSLSSARAIACREPRQLLADILPGEFNTLLKKVRPEKQQDVRDMMAGVWSDAMRPFVQPGGAVDEGRASPEECMILKLARQPQHRELWGDILLQLEINEAIKTSLHHMKQKCYEASRSLFSSDLDVVFWRCVAVSLGLLPLGSDKEDVSRADLGACAQVQDAFEFLSAPYTLQAGRCVVKGSHCEFHRNMQGGPHTKYDALFDSRSEFDGMRYSFLLFVGKRALVELPIAAESRRQRMSGSSYQMLMRFADKYSDAFADQSLDEQPSDFAARAWPLLRQCLTSEQGYYLSYSELLLVCEVHRKTSPSLAPATILSYTWVHVFMMTGPLFVV